MKAVYFLAAVAILVAAAYFAFQQQPENEAGSSALEQIINPILAPVITV